MKFYFYLICIVLCSVTAQATQSENEKKIDSIIRSIPNGDRYESKEIMDKIYEAKKQILAIDTCVLPVLFDRWQPTMNPNQINILFDVIGKLLDSTIFTRLYKKNSEMSDGRIAYFNSAILYAAMWDDESLLGMPRRDWGDCPIELLDIWFAHLDDTSTLTFQNSKSNYDFVRGIISKMVNDIVNECRAKSPESVEQCIKNAMPNNTVKVPMNFLYGAGIFQFLARSIEKTEDGKQLLKLAVEQKKQPTPEQFRKWYKNHRNELVWDRNSRWFNLK